MSDQPFRGRLVVHAPTQTLKTRQRFGVALSRPGGVPSDNLLEVGILGHDKPPRDTFVPQ
jgi:hypothetical protein